MKTKIIEFLKPDLKKMAVLLSIAVVFLLLLANLNVGISKVYYFRGEGYAYEMLTESMSNFMCQLNNTMCWHILENKSELLRDVNLKGAKSDTLESIERYNETMIHYNDLETSTLQDIRNSKTVTLLSILAPITQYKWTDVYKNLASYREDFEPDIMFRGNATIVLFLNLIYWYGISCLMVWGYGKIICKIKS